MNFQFSTASTIRFGCGVTQEAVPLALAEGQRFFIITGSRSSCAEQLMSDLTAQGAFCRVFKVCTEPTVEVVQAATDVAGHANVDMIIALGGGSVLDTGKAVAALLANPGDLLDYLEVIGKGKVLSAPSIPLMAIPTTSGTGAEVTRNAVITSTEHRVKVSLRSPTMLPKIALIDPELTLSVPPAITAATGMDALVQLMEAYVSPKANPMTDALARQGLIHASRSLLHAYQNGADIAARQDMALASLCGGLALANAGLGAVHGFAGPIGGMYPVPHGIACAALLPEVMRMNVRALQRRQGNSPALAKYQDIAGLLTAKAQPTLEDGIDWAESVTTQLEIPTLGSFGIGRQAIALLVGQAKCSSSMKGNPILLEDEELVEILERSL